MMMQHYDIDGLIEYGVESIPGTTEIINPVWRTLDRKVRTTRQTEQKLQANFAKLTMEAGDEIQNKAEKLEEIQAIQTELKSLRDERKNTQKKVTIESLPEGERPTQLLPLNKMLTDSVKMIAYRSETALVALLRRYLNKRMRLVRLSGNRLFHPLILYPTCWHRH